MRRLVPLLAWLLTARIATTAGASSRSALPLDQCLLRFELMKTRPWLGV